MKNPKFHQYHGTQVKFLCVQPHSSAASPFSSPLIQYRYDKSACFQALDASATKNSLEIFGSTMMFVLNSLIFIRHTAF